MVVNESLRENGVYHPGGGTLSRLATRALHFKESPKSDHFASLELLLRFLENF